MQQPPQGQGWPPQMQQPNGYGQTPTNYGQPPYTPYPPQQGQWQQPFAPPPPPPPYYPPQQGQWQQSITPNPQWSQQQPFGYPPPQKPKKKSHPILIALGVIFVLFLCIGSAMFLRGGSSPDTSTTTNSSSSASSNATSVATTVSSVATKISSSSSNTSSSNTTASQVYKVGYTITVDGVACTLVSVNTLAGDEFAQPKPGNQFIVVHVKIQNGNSQQTDYNAFDFHAKSGAGNVTDEDFSMPSSYTANNELNSGQLDPGGTVEGDIIFQVPIGDHKAELTWQPSIFENSTQNAWNLGL